MESRKPKYKNPYTTLQQIMQLPYGLAIGTVPMIAFGFGGPLPPPLIYGFELASPSINIQSGSASYHLVTQTSPLDYVRQVGGGSAWKGLGIEVAKFVAALSPMILVGTGVGWLVAHYQAPLVAALPVLHFIANTPVIREPIVGVFSLGMFVSARVAIEKYFPSPSIQTIDGAPLYSVQLLVPLLWMRPYNAIAFMKTVRTALVTAAQMQAANDWRFLALTGAMDQFLQGWFYSLYTVQPFFSLVPRDQWTDQFIQRTPSKEEEGYTLSTVMQRAPERTDLAKAVAFYGFRTTASIASAAVCAYGVNSLITELTSIEFMAVTGTFYMAGMMVEQLLQAGAVYFSPRLFGRRPQAFPRVEEVTENDLGVLQTVTVKQTR